MAEVIIFGIKDLAELANYYLRTDSEHRVVAFTVNAAFMPEIPVFHDLPVVPFEDIEKLYSPENYSLFAPLTHKNMNCERRRIYTGIKNKGYNLISYVSSKATVFDNTKIGDNCFILEDNTIQPFVEIGNDVVLWSGNHIGHHSVIKDHVFLTSHVVISGNCIIEPNCFLGVNSALKENLTIGEGTFISMSSSITTNTEPFSVYTGNPAKRIDMSSLKIRY